ncbi:hypothetical protein [Pseudomonas fontis]|uniref:Uncharacterized protein n=1 Tax=Pseudomonas fontis TaxID=2942633 RepID=A0ABT5NXM6_9PSED|nr:hypothetical protein [Pseudomonas fontis]MDD0973802.1 hypothetical protein [Pseudomonas fontis]MDD0992936.1 hypothetical protein [Pseudomonas fontis]
MFEKVAVLTAKTLYALTIGVGVIWLAWLCLANLPLWMAVLMFCLGLPVLALAATPIAAGGALLGGLVAGLLAVIADSVSRRPQRGG